MKRHCTYEENGYLVESDFVDETDLKEYFKDSYKHHLGKLPSMSQIRDYLSGIAVLVLDGNGNLSSCFQGVAL